MNQFWIYILLICTLACGGGGGAGSTSASNAVPSIRNFMLSPTRAVQDEGGGEVSSFLSLEFSDADGDITSLRLTSGSQSEDLAIQGASGITEGTLTGHLNISTVTPWTFDIQVALVDAKGQISNPLSCQFQVTLPAPTITSLTPQSVLAGGPAFALIVRGTNFTQSSRVLWNGNPRATTFVSNTELSASITAPDIANQGTATIQVENPDLDGGRSLGFSLSINPDIKVLVSETPVNDVVYDSIHNVFYASLGSMAGLSGNSIAVIDPATGTTTSTVFAGSEPTCLAISSDGQYLYVGLNGSASIKRFLLPDLISDISIPLGADPFFGAYHAIDIQVAPGASGTIAVTLGCSGVSPVAQGGVAIWDNATPRSVKLAGGFNLFDCLQWGADSTRLYSATTTVTSFNYFILDVDSAGVHLNSNVYGAFNAFGSVIHFDGTSGNIYSDTGRVLSAATGQLVGTFPTTGTMTFDSTRNSAFFLSANWYHYPVTFDIKSYNKLQFTPVSTVSVPVPSRSQTTRVA